MRWVRALGLTALVVGCAGRGRGASADPAEVAKGLYNVGEQRFAAGRADQAVALWRHAIAQLPGGPDHDALRHRLFLRLGHGELVAYARHHKLVHLYEGKRVLERYLVVHEDLFGDGARARRERGEIYELLGTIELEIEAPQAVAVERLPDAAPTTDPAASPVAADALASAAVEPLAADATAAARPVSTEVRRRPRRVRKWYEHPDDMNREVWVDTRKPRPDIFDPVVRKRIARWNPEFPANLWFMNGSTAPHRIVVSDARPLVQLAGRAQLAEPGGTVRAREQAHQRAKRLVDAARVDMRACYEQAFVRTSIETVAATVELTIAPDGRVERTIVDGTQIGDALGTVCVLEALQRTELAHAETPVRVRIPLLFFYDRAVVFDESDGSTVAVEFSKARQDRAAIDSYEGGIVPRERVAD